MYVGLNGSIDCYTLLVIIFNLVVLVMEVRVYWYVSIIYIYIDFNVLLNINFDNNLDLTLVIHCNGIRRSHAKRDELYLVAAIHVGPPDCSNTVNPEHVPAEYIKD